MPRLMEKSDWIRAASGIRALDRVWQEDVLGSSNVVPLSLPEAGRFRVYLVKVDEDGTLQMPKQRSARDMLGYGARFHKLRKTEEWMQELREGENG